MGSLGLALLVVDVLLSIESIPPLPECDGDWVIEFDRDRSAAITGLE